MNARAWRQVLGYVVANRREIIAFIIAGVVLWLAWHAQHDLPPVSPEEADVYFTPP